MNDFHSDSQGHPLVEDLSTALLAGSVVFSNGSNLAEDNDNFFWDNVNKMMGIGTNTPSHNLEVVGDMELTHIATESDEHAFEIDVDADGFGDVKALDIFYDTGAIVTGQDEEAILVQFDEFDATGGDLTALGVLVTEGGADMIIGLFAGALVNPIQQLSGIFADMDSALVNAVDELADLINASVDTNIFVADNDTVTIGDAAKFEEIGFILTTVSSGAGIRPKFEFSTGVGTWTEFNPTDGTNQMRNNGVIAFLNSDIPTWAIGTGSEFLIRITRERNSLVTTPVAKKVQISATTEFSWDKDGVVTISALNVSDGNITNVGDIALNTISSDDGTSISVILGTDAGDDFIVGNNSALVVTGDDDRVGIGTNAPGALLDVRGSAIFNEDGGDNDFRIEGDTDSSLFFSDASTNRIGVGTNAPDQKFHIFSSDNTAKIHVEESGTITANTPLLHLESTNVSAQTVELRIENSAASWDFEVGASGTFSIAKDGTGGVETAFNARNLADTLRLFGGMIINENGAAAGDFRVEGDTMNHMIFTDASPSTENIALLAASLPNWQSMDRGIFIGDATTVPTGNPTGGGFLYVEAGALKYRGPTTGFVTIIAVA